MALPAFQATVINNEGQPVPFAQIEVRSELSGLLVSLWSDRDGTLPVSNPFTADNNGFARFFVAAGDYRLDIDDGSASRTLRYFAIGFGAPDIPVAEAAGGSAGISAPASDAQAAAMTNDTLWITPLNLATLQNVFRAAFPPCFLSGLGIAQAADTDHDITVAAGSARDGADGANIILASPITKQIDAAWSVGSNAGGLDTGAVANNSWYYLWLIQRPDTGVVDVLFSLSGVSPTMPTGYTLKRRIPGVVRTNASANILAFTQQDLFTCQFTVAIEDAEATISAATLVTLTVPPVMRALFRFSSRTAAAFWVVQPTTETSATPSATAPPGQSGGVGIVAGELEVQADASSQIRVVPDAASRAYSIHTKGFKDFRWMIGA